MSALQTSQDNYLPICEQIENVADAELSDDQAFGKTSDLSVADDIATFEQFTDTDTAANAFMPTSKIQPC